MKLRIIVLAGLCLTALAGCGKDIEFPIPEGIQTVRAVLQQVPFSLTRRGTHALIGADGKMAAYAESTAVSLHALEGRDVTLEGIFEKNSDPKALPVLIVQKVIDGGEDMYRPWSIPALGLSIELPRNWKGTVQGKSASFTASGLTVPILRITSTPNPSPSPAYGSSSLPASGDLFVVGLRKAVANMSADGSSWVVNVTSPAVQMTFAFAFRSDATAQEQLPAYRSILKSVDFVSSVTSSGGFSSVSSGSPVRSSPGAGSLSSQGSATSRAPGEGAPCGGPAGILCPKGLYCKISDTTIQSGVCAKK